MTGVGSSNVKTSARAGARIWRGLFLKVVAAELVTFEHAEDAVVDARRRHDDNPPETADIMALFAGRSLESLPSISEDAPRGTMAPRPHAPRISSNRLRPHRIRDDVPPNRPALRHPTTPANLKDPAEQRRRKKHPFDTNRTEATFDSSITTRPAPAIPHRKKRECRRSSHLVRHPTYPMPECGATHAPCHAQRPPRRSGRELASHIPPARRRALSRSPSTPREAPRVPLRTGVLRFRPLRNEPSKKDSQ
ncbi:Uncharacterised protein [Burkholderia pseudomallei]|nr:Uncharacterised protein [Burkholderia pseudomallei]CAJ6316265.1 Uncharacterised protein [Burkholderia pseudomallei]CAJ7168010.1 Uncharacterised protein [Burkholderia pseudomallei]CAJ8416746.1 Uncharacterised protein [Burkholderia pseudomallei]VBG94096.1 Uncharacterised protein [Burkholderia pseudomallei]